MLKFKATTPDGAPVFGFGLCEENVKRLKAGQPIKVDLRSVGNIGEAYVVILYGKDERELVDMIQGNIGPETEVRDERNRKDG